MQETIIKPGALTPTSCKNVAISDAFGAYVLQMISRKVDKRTIITYRNAISPILDEPVSIKKTALMKKLNKAFENQKPSTIRSKEGIIRVFFDWCCESKIIKKNPIQ